MTRVAHFRWRPYGVALVADGLAFILTWLLQPFLAPTVFALFYPAVMVSSLYGGTGPGIFASVLAALIAKYFFLPSLYSFEFEDLGTLVRLGALLSVALMISVLSSGFRHAKRRAEINALKLQESQMLFQQFMQHSPVTAFVKDDQGRYLYVNPLAERLFNRDLADWLGKTDFELFPPEIAQPIYENDQVVLSTQRPTQMRETMQMRETDKQSEAIRSYMSFKFPIRDYRDRQLLGGMSVDITQLQSTEDALRESEARFNRLAATNLIGFLTWNLQGQILDANDAFLQLVGYSREELQRGQINWQAMTPPEHWAIDQEVIEELKQLGKKTPFETELICKDGSRVSVLLGSTFLEQTQNQGVSFVLDLTEHKQVQATLRASEERYRLVTESLPQIIGIADAMGQVEYCNPYWYTYTGLTEAQSLGSGWQQVLHPDDVEPTKNRLQKAIETGKQHEIEYRLRSASGEYRWYLAAVGPISDGNGQIMQWVGTAIDIDQIKRAEAERTQLLQAAERARAEAEIERGRLQEFFRQAPAMIAFVRGPEHVYEFVNASYQHVAGRTEPELIGRAVGEVFPEIEGQGFLAILDQVYRTNTPYEGTEVVIWYDRNQDGILQEVFFNFVYQPLQDATGQVEGVLMHAVEVTEQVHARRRTEELLQQLEAERALLEAVLQQMPAGVVIAEAPSGRLLLGNAQVAEIWRHPFIASAEVEQYCVYKGFHPDGRPYAPEEWALARSLQTGEIVTQEEVKFLRGDQTYGIMEVSSSPIRNRQGQIVAGVVTFADITERKQAEQEREQLLSREQAARADAEAANRIKDEFLAVLSHELRTPLNPILGWTKLLRSGNLDAAKVDSALEVIERNAKLQTQLIEDLLDVSRILQGKLKLNSAPVYLASTVEAAIETVRLAAEAKAIQIQTWIEPAVRPVIGDGGRLQQVIWNLLSNAVKFTPEGGRVEVRLRQIGSHAQIQVCDTGKGISPEFLPHIFEYFRQADGTTTRAFGGLGLGLAIARHLVELHGGSIAATSPGEGQGATFTVQLPTGTAALSSSRIQDGRCAALNLQGLRVLAVDDEADMRELLKVLLEQQGMTVTLAASAQEALVLLPQIQPDLLLSDIGMPETDGYMLLKQVRSLAPAQGGQTPAIALTAYAAEADQKQAIAAGFQAHVAKPVEPDTLIEAIVRLVNSASDRPVYESMA